MKRIFYILAIIAVASVFHSCGTEYFECTVMSPETDEVLPQEGCALKVPFRHYPVTRFQPGEATRLLNERIPLNHKGYKAISIGELRMSDSGFFIIENENRKRGISGRDTMLGQIVKEDRDSFHSFCMDESDGLIVTLTLLP